MAVDTMTVGRSGWWTASILYTLVYVLFISVMPTVANLTMNTMVTKQGIAGAVNRADAIASVPEAPKPTPRADQISTGRAVADIGKGELAAAMEGLNLITGVLLPPVSGALYSFFL